MPSHSHTTTVNEKTAGGNPDNRYMAGTTGTVGSAINYNTNSQGSDGAHNNLQPFNVINYIIKT